jgi:hypothetical protein
VGDPRRFVRPVLLPEIGAAGQARIEDARARAAGNASDALAAMRAAHGVEGA